MWLTLRPVENLQFCIIIVKSSLVSMTAAAAAAAAAAKLHPIGARQARAPTTGRRLRRNRYNASETHKIVETLAIRRIWGYSGCARRSTIFTYKYTRPAPCTATGKWITARSLLIATR